jgi:dipeptide/tripeptide permease
VGFWVLIIVFAILVFLLDKILNKLLGIEKKKISETSGRKIDRWGRGIILVIFLCTLPFVITQDTNVIKWYWILYVILVMGFQSILEWKYLKDSKQHVTTLIFLMLSVIILYNIEYFL